VFGSVPVSAAPSSLGEGGARSLGLVLGPGLCDPVSSSVDLQNLQNLQDDLQDDPVPSSGSMRWRGWTVGGSSRGHTLC
jgi:hypothetical protein